MEKPDLEKGRKLFASNCEFLLSASQIDGIPVTAYPEVAFAGRSNVGKSSLVNAVTGRKSLAKTSGTPGHTRTLNFFLLGGRLMIVDLPGYGYARTGRKEVENWTELTKDYLRGRTNLARVCLLIDSRHGLKENDIEVMNLLDDCAVSYQIVLTKADKVKKQDVEKIIASIDKIAPDHTALHPKAILTSSHKGDGLEELRAELANFCG